MTIEIERLRHAGRGLVRDEENTDPPPWPQVAAEAVRGLAHLTMTTAPIPAPTVYEVLGKLKDLGLLLPQVLDQLTRGLARSLTVSWTCTTGLASTRRTLSSRRA